MNLALFDFDGPITKTDTWKPTAIRALIAAENQTANG